MRRNIIWLFSAIFLGLISLAGFCAYLRKLPVDARAALEELVLCVVCAALAVLLFRTYLRASKKSKAFPQPQTKAPEAYNTYETFEPFHTFEIHTESADPDEDIALSPEWAKLKYLDAKALKFRSGRSTDFVIPAHYSQTAFGRNVGSALGRFLAGGYLRLCSVKGNIELKTVPELKAVLASRGGLKVSGKKAELVQRLLDNCSEEELRSLFPVGRYVMTEKGEQAFAPYSVALCSHGYGPSFSHFRLMGVRNKHPELTDQEIIDQLIHEDIQRYYQTHDLSAYQVLLSEATYFYISYDQPEQAMDSMILSFFIWSMDIADLRIEDPHVDNFRGKRLEEFATDRGLSFSQLVDRMRRTIQRENPFRLGTKKNVDYSVYILKKSLGLN